MRIPLSGFLLGVALASARMVCAETITLDMVPVGDSGNVGDATGFGAVSYNYQIGKYDITAAQYTAFLNAVAATDTYNLYNTDMNSTRGCGISRGGLSGTYTYSTTKNGNYPVNYVSWGDAARFCNWLSNGQPTGAEDASTTETGPYVLNGATSGDALMAVPTPVHNGPGVGGYFIPSEDEWYKAAYYKSGGTNAGYWAYPIRNNAAPVNLLLSSGTNNANFYDAYGTGNHGYTDPVNYLTPVGYFAASPGPYGTFDQGGGVWQWNETNGNFSFRGIRGGSFSEFNDPIALGSEHPGAAPPDNEYSNVGFRVASSVAVPEPGSIALLLAAAAGVLVLRKSSGSRHSKHLVGRDATETALKRERHET